MTTKVLISLPQKFLEDLDRIAAKEQRSRSEFIREAVRIYLNTQIDKKVNESSARYSAKTPVSKPVKKFPNIEVVKFTGGSSAVTVKANYPLTYEKMTHILEELAATAYSTICPHGRPVMLRLTRREIEKNFQRI